MNELANLLADLKKESRISSDAINAEMTKRDEVINAKKNDTENTEQAGRGKELVPMDTLGGQIIYIQHQQPGFVQALTGFQGMNMGKSEKRTIVGDIDLPIANPEWLTGAGLIDAGTHRISTSEITITQQPMIAQVDVSDRLKTYSILDMEAYVKERMALSFKAAQEQIILNADNTLTATGNINSDDQSPTTGFANGAKDIRLLYDAKGLRKVMLDGGIGVTHINVGTMEWEDWIASRALLGRYSTDLSNLMIITNGPTYNKALTIEEFKKANENGASSTITTGAMSRVSGVDMYFSPYYGLTDDDGKINTVPGAAGTDLNKKGGWLYIRKNAVQFGYGKDVELDYIKIPGKGFAVIGTMEFGFNTIDRPLGDDPWIVGAINATVSF